MPHILAGALQFNLDHTRQHAHMDPQTSAVQDVDCMLATVIACAVLLQQGSKADHAGLPDGARSASTGSH